MDFIKGVTFAPFAPRGTFEKEEAYDSLDNLVKLTNADFIILVPNGLQDTPQSKNINFKVGGQAVLGRQHIRTTPWLTERHGYDPT